MLNIHYIFYDFVGSFVVILMCFFCPLSLFVLVSCFLLINRAVTIYWKKLIMQYLVFL